MDTGNILTIVLFVALGIVLALLFRKMDHESKLTYLKLEIISATDLLDLHGKLIKEKQEAGMEFGVAFEEAFQEAFPKCYAQAVESLTLGGDRYPVPLEEAQKSMYMDIVGIYVELLKSLEGMTPKEGAA